MDIRRFPHRILSQDQFLMVLAHDVVRLADQSEGLKAWMQRHADCDQAPRAATRCYSRRLFGDSPEASSFNTFVTLQIDRRQNSRLAAV